MNGYVRHGFSMQATFNQYWQHNKNATNINDDIDMILVTDSNPTTML